MSKFAGVDMIYVRGVLAINMFAATPLISLLANHFGVSYEQEKAIMASYLPDQMRKPLIRAVLRDDYYPI